MAFVGGILIAYVLGDSMQPSARAKAARSQHDVSTLKNGSYRIEAFSRPNFWANKVLLIRDWDNQLYVYILPTKDEKTIMPDRWWGWGYYDCADFRPDLDKTGSIKKSGSIRCHDKEKPEWMADQWEWSYDGTPKDQWGINMNSPSTELKSGTLYINQ